MQLATHRWEAKQRFLMYFYGNQAKKYFRTKYFFGVVNILFYSHKYILRGCVSGAINLTVNLMITSQNENYNTVSSKYNH